MKHEVELKSETLIRIDRLTDLLRKLLDGKITITWETK